MHNGETQPGATPQSAMQHSARLKPSSVDELSTLLKEQRKGLRIRGAGTWLAAGHPTRSSQELDVSAFAGVREYTPADLTISVGAATTLAELDAVTRAQGQWCPLLAWGDDRGTVGATVATATSGPFADALGRPRDLVLGMECVDGRGRVVRAGGRVVKNVAGFDLTRLVTGSWGTLAVITELHLRLRARPAVDRSYYIEGADAAAMRAFARGVFAPLAVLPVQSVAPQAADTTRTSYLEQASAWLVRLGGNEELVAAAIRALHALGRCEERDESVWMSVREQMVPPERATKWNWTPIALRVKRAFDPRDLLNPGLLGDAQCA